MKLSLEQKSNSSVFAINSKENEKVNIQDVWSKFLNQFRWSWFVTLTFRHIVSTKTANTKWNRWLREIKKETDKIGYFRVTEYQQRGALHYHALILGVEILRRLTYMDIWKDIAGGYARIFEYDPTKAARFYLCNKYITKELVDWKLGGSILRT